MQTAADAQDYRVKDLERTLHETVETYEHRAREIKEENNHQVLALEAATAAKDEAIRTCNTQVRNLVATHQTTKNALEESLRDLKQSRHREEKQINELNSIRKEL